MASPVPYDPVPQIAPSGQGIPPLHMDVPSGAFGSGVADAITHLGGVEQQGGSELFDRALAMQQTNQLAEATKASADYSDKISSLHADYTSKEGVDAVNGLSPFQKQVSDIREQIRGGLTSPMSQQAFDQQSRYTQSWAVRTGSGYAAAQNKRVVNDASTARMDAAMNQVLSTPFDDESFNNGLKVVETEARHKAAVAGASPEVTQEMVDVSTSNLRVAKLTGMAKTDPFGAQKLLDQWSKTGVLPGPKSAAEQVGKDVGIAAEPGEAGKTPFKGPGGTAYKPGSVEIKPGADLGDLSPSAKNMMNGIVNAGISPKVIAGFAPSGHVGHSQHYVGNAVDFDVTGWSSEQKAALIQAGIQNGARGVGIYPSGNSIHMDTRDNPTAWGPNPEGIYKGAAINQFPPWAQQVLGPMFQQGTRGGGLIRGDKLPEVSYRIQQSVNTIGAKQQASTIMNGDPAWGNQPDVSVGRIAEAIRGNESGGRYNLIHPPAPNGDHALGAYGIMSKNLAPWLKEAGMPVMSEQEFLQNPAAQDKLAGFKLGQYWDEYHNANMVASRWFTGSAHPYQWSTDGHTSVTAYLQKFNTGLGRNASAADFQSVAGQRAGQLLPGNTEFQDALQNQLETLHRRQESIDRETETNNRLTIYDSMMQPGKDGHLPDSLDALTPEAQQAFQGLNASNQSKILESLTSRTGGEYAFTPETQAQYREAMGTAAAVGTSHPPSPEALEKFMDTDFTAAKWPLKRRQEMVQIQRQLTKAEDASPMMGHAMQVLTPMFGASGFDPKDQETKAQFIGQLHEMMATYQQTYKKPPGDEDIKNMGRTLFTNIQTPGRLFGSLWQNSTPAFQMDVPKEAADMIHSQWTVQKGSEPTEDEIRAVYLAQQYISLYGKQAKPMAGAATEGSSPKGAKAIITPGGSPATGPAPATPQVPISQ